MCAIREIQDPKYCHLIKTRVTLSPYALIQAPFAELRFAFRVLIQVYSVVVKNIERCDAFVEGISKRVRTHKIEIVSRGVVFRILSKWCPHDAPYGEVETGRTELSFVITIGEKIDNSRIAAFAQNVFEHSI